MIWINILAFSIECVLLLLYTPRLSGKHQLYYIDKLMTRSRIGSVIPQRVCPIAALLHVHAWP